MGILLKKKKNTSEPQRASFEKELKVQVSKLMPVYFDSFLGHRRFVKAGPCNSKDLSQTYKVCSSRGNFLRECLSQGFLN